MEKTDIIKKLFDENAFLKQENAYLKELLLLNHIELDNKGNVANEHKEKLSEEHKGTSKAAIEEERNNQIDLFRSLFKGREDVFARGYISKKSGKIAYSPACSNFWKDNLCSRKMENSNSKRINCYDCPNCAWISLDNDIIWHHLQGKDEQYRDVIGIYPMLPDGTCSLLVFDFDDENWQEDVNNTRIICKKNNIKPYVERSRSGEGAHVWFFFQTPLPAYTARKFGAALMTRGADLVNQPNFKSYDRMLPNQDYMPKGGLGNLIALPFQGRARRNGNSVFIDEKENPILNIMDFFRNIKKLSSEFVDEKIAEWTKLNGELGILTKYEAGEKEKPWEKSASISLSSSDVPDELELIKANMLYLEKKGCSPRFLNQIRRLAAFSNPEFYKKRAMHLSTRDIPRIIQCNLENDKYVYIPRGCEDKLIELVKTTDCDYQIIDERQVGRNVSVEFQGELYEKQLKAAKSLLMNDNGIISAAPGFGKTVIGCWLIAQRKVNTLILVQNHELMNQWFREINKFLKINEEVPVEYTPAGRIKKSISIVGLLGGQKNTLHRIVDIAMMQSLIKNNEVNEAVKDYGMVIVDECHHIGAFTFEQILDEVNAKYVYGLSATPYREDGHHPIIFMQCGPVRYQLTTKDRLAELELKSWVVPRFTRFVPPVSLQKNNISDIYKALIKDEIRNNLIVEDIIENIKQGRSPIVLTKFINHADILAEKLKQKIENVFLLKGGMSSKEKQSIVEKVKNIPDPKSMVIVAIGKYIGEGFDLPRLDTLFLTMPISWKGNIEQYAGRLHRKYKGKEDVIIYDYVDFHVSMLENMYHKRLSRYAKLGYEISNTTDNSKIKSNKNNSIYTNENYTKAFEEDLQNAKYEIIISSPYMAKNRVKYITKIVLEVMVKGVKVAYATKRINDAANIHKERLEELHLDIESNSIKLLLKESFCQKCAVIDQKIIWFGGVNILANGKDGECIMRISDQVIARELLEDIL